MSNMRDILTEISDGQPIDPTEAARRTMRGPARKRFYDAASVGEGSEGFDILLDGKPVRTPARRLLALPDRSLAETVAAEWESQREMVDPAAMPLTRLANSIIDGVKDTPGPVADEIGRYLASDMLFYRAESPEGLLASQARHWDPLLEWARDVLGARFILAQGVFYAEQPAEALAAARAAIPNDPWLLGALDSVTTITGSALIALALAAGRVTPDAAWAAAHVDEDWNMDFWGRDPIALERRSVRRKELDAAAKVMSALKR
jgi:chaperone required for assembly of F1-ATPase